MSDKPRYSSLILASGSAPRAELLARLNLPFERVPADIDESPLPGESPVDLVERLSRGKAAAVARSHPDALVIGSDQVAVFDGEATSKPGTVERARERLRRFSGHSVTFLTGVAVQDARGHCDDYFLDTTTVDFRDLEHDEIERYIAADDPLQCAGVFKVESLGPVLFRAVRSEDPTALPGLPLIGLARVLRRHGFALP